MNPFRDTIVADPWRTPVDVPEIHAEVFQDCVRALEQVRQRGGSGGLLIHGAAGSGKTHLLSRLRNHLTLQAPTATDRQESLFVWVRLQTSPRMIWRHVRRSLVEDWFRPVRGQRIQFERVLFHRLAALRVAEGDLEPWFDFMREEHPQELEALLERVADAQNLDRNTTLAFKHLAFDRYRRDLRAWLAGDSLPEETLARLELTQEEGTDAEREDEARRVVIMLCRLAGETLPMLLSFDQVEALQATPDDREGLFAFGQLIGALHDETNNLLLVSCVQSSFADDLMQRLRGADYDRLTSLGKRSLAMLTRPQAERLIAARLTGVSDTIRLPARRDPLWPLESGDWDQLAGLGELTPRRLLATCAERYEAWSQSAPASAPPPLSFAAWLQQVWTARLRECQASNHPHISEEILRHALPLLAHWMFPEVRLEQDDLLPDVALVFTTPRERRGLSFCMQSNMNSLTAHLKRLLSQHAPQRLQRLILLRDKRLSISPTAKKARSLLEELERLQAIMLHPTADLLAELDAVRRLWSDASSGDLDYEGQTVSAQELGRELPALFSAELRDFAQRLWGPTES